MEQRFNLWLGREKKQNRDYTEEQQAWLREIAKFIAANAEITPRDLLEAPSFADKGGLMKATQLFGSNLNQLIDELQVALIA